MLMTPSVVTTTELFISFCLLLFFRLIVYFGVYYIASTCVQKTNKQSFYFIRILRVNAMKMARNALDYGTHKME